MGSKSANCLIWEKLCVCVCVFSTKEICVPSTCPKDRWIHRYTWRTWVRFDSNGFHVFSLCFPMTFCGEKHDHVSVGYSDDSQRPCEVCFAMATKIRHSKTTRLDGLDTEMQWFCFTSWVFFGVQAFKYWELASKYGSWELQSWYLQMCFFRAGAQTKWVLSFTCQMASTEKRVAFCELWNTAPPKKVATSWTATWRKQGVGLVFLQALASDRISIFHLHFPRGSIFVWFNIPTYRKHHDNNEYELLRKESHWLGCHLRDYGEPCLFKGEANIEGDGVKLSRSETFAVGGFSTYITPPANHSPIDVVVIFYTSGWGMQAKALQG